METLEKIKWINKGMELQRRVDANNEPMTCSQCWCYDAFKNMLAEQKRIYCGTADNVEFFKTVINILGLDEYIDYTVEDVDSELEIVIGGNV